MPANSNNLPPLASRNFLLRPLNQSSQKGFVSARFVRQIQGRDVSEGVFSSVSKDGTETRAEVVLRIVRERKLFPLDLVQQHTKEIHVLPLDSRR